MKTFVDVYISSNGMKMSEVVQELLNMGLTPTIGDHDFEYEWEDPIPTVATVAELANAVQDRLADAQVMLRFVTKRQ